MPNQTRAEAKAVRDAAVAAFRISELELPRNNDIRDSLNPLKGKISFGPGADPFTLNNAAAYLAAYGHEGRVRDGALALGPIEPATWNIVYEPIRQLTHVAFHFAHRAGDTSGAEQLEPLLFREGDSYDIFRGVFIPSQHPPGTPTVGDRPTAEMLSGAWLNRPFENVGKYDNPGPHGRGGRTEDRLASAAAGDVLTASMMWVWGGSADWPRERIDDYVDALIPQWHALDGWAPGW
jgi:hypothetical protein